MNRGIIVVWCGLCLCGGAFADFAAGGWNMFDRRLGLFVHWGVYATARGQTLYLHCPKGLTRGGLDLSPLSALPVSATLLNTGASLACECVPMPGSFAKLKRPCLHVRGIPADDLSNESVVVRLEFSPDVQWDEDQKGDCAL